MPAVMGTQRRGVIWRSPKHFDPAALGQTRWGGYRGGAKTPPHWYALFTPRVPISGEKPKTDVYFFNAGNVEPE